MADRQTDIRYLFRREHTIQGSNGWTRDEPPAHHHPARLRGEAAPVVDRVLPLEQTAEGERAMERREVIGKVVIHMSAPRGATGRRPSDPSG